MHHPGLFFDWFTTQQSSTVFGSQVAINDFLPAMLRHSRADQLTVITQPTDPVAVGADLRRRLRTDIQRRGGGVRVHAYDPLAGAQGPPRASVWHDHTGNISRALALRGRAVRLTPFTAVTHTVSRTALAYHWYLRLLLEDVRACDSIICTSVAARDAVANVLAHTAESFAREHGVLLRYRGRLDVIPLGVDTQRFRPRPPGPARVRLGLASSAFVILWLGRFSAMDKADLLPLLRVFARLVRKYPRRQLTLALGGTDYTRERPALERYAAELRIADHVHWLPRLEDHERALAYAAADLFVSPVDNIQESFGLTPIEAMACGVPQVVSDWNGYKETVVHGTTGLRVPTSWSACDRDLVDVASAYGNLDHLMLAQATAVDVEALFTALDRLLVDDRERRRMAEQSRGRAVSCYGWRTVIRQYDDLWQELARVARRDRRPPSPRDSFRVPFFAAFGHYATSIVDDHSRAAPTSFGGEVIRGTTSLPAFYAHRARLDVDLLLALLSRCAGSRPRSLLALTRRAPALSLDDRARRHWMWLFKHGLIRRVG